MQFGYNERVPWIGPSPAFEFQTNGCVGCHSLAPSGTRMSYTSGDSEFGVFETTSGTPSPLTGLLAREGAEWTALHPTGTWAVGVDLLGRIAAAGRRGRPPWLPWEAAALSTVA